MNWKAIQTKLGQIPDGVPGPNTYRALFEAAASRNLGETGNKLARTASKYFTQYGMTTPERIAEFIAQCCNETGGFQDFEENLNYSAASALKTWPKHFNEALATWAARNPERIAEVAYGVKSRQGVGRMGNTQPGDGYKYRGRGMLQLTGKDNYKHFGATLGLDLLNHPELAADPEDSLLIALEFFRQGNVNKAVDRGDYKEARRITNGGDIGLVHVQALREKLLRILK
jgi:putative chitinase